MAVDDLPGPVVNLLNVIGVPWPYVNEDTVTQFATLAREFGTAVQTTHQDSTAAVAGIAQAHQGASTQAMHSGWTTMSAQHVDELVTACGVLADALDVGAGYIVAQKLEAIATLIGMAMAFIADQAASVFTLVAYRQAAYLAAVTLLAFGLWQAYVALKLHAGLVGGYDWYDFMLRWTDRLAVWLVALASVASGSLLAARTIVADALARRSGLTWRPRKTTTAASWRSWLTSTPERWRGLGTGGLRFLVRGEQQQPPDVEVHEDQHGE